MDECSHLIEHCSLKLGELKRIAMCSSLASRADKTPRARRHLLRQVQGRDPELDWSKPMAEAMRKTSAIIKETATGDSYPTDQSGTGDCEEHQYPIPVKPALYSGSMPATHSNFIPAGIPSSPATFGIGSGSYGCSIRHEGAAGGRPRVRADVEPLKKPSVFGLVVGASASAPQLASRSAGRGRVRADFPRRVEGWERGSRRPSRSNTHDPDGNSDACEDCAQWLQGRRQPRRAHRPRIVGVVQPAGRRALSSP